MYRVYLHAHDADEIPSIATMITDNHLDVHLLPDDDFADRVNNIDNAHCCLLTGSFRAAAMASFVKPEMPAIVMVNREMLRKISSRDRELAYHHILPRPFTAVELMIRISAVLLHR